MLIDTHAHLNFNAYKNDLDQVIKRALDNNIWVVNVGSKYETSRKAVEIAQKYPEGVFSAVGLHPIYAGAGLFKIKTDPEEGDFKAKEESFDKERYRKLANSEKVVAIGETGLDYYYRPKTKTKLELFKQKQKEIFTNQLDLAKELDLAVIVHCRMAHEDLIEILKKHSVRGVVHCFTGTWSQAQKYMDMGFYLGINGIIYKMDLDEVIKKCPLKSILVETDCPYLTPPQGGSKRNEPIFVKHVIQKIADLKKISFDQVAQKTTQNAKQLFKI